MGLYDDLNVDDILKNRKKRKKAVNSKNKGKRGELQLVKLLNKRFKKTIVENDENAITFSRVVGSGNRWSHVANVSNDYIGDIVCPKDFKFCIECKFGYPEINLHNILNQKCKALDKFLKQAKDDAKRSKKKPLLCWKQDRQSWIAFFKEKDLNLSTESYIEYKSWIGVPFDIVLLLPDKQFFDNA